MTAKQDTRNKEQKEVSRCCSKDCGLDGVVTIRVDTDEGPVFMGFCSAHVLKGAEVLVELAKSILTGEEKWR